jgi:hypothetical protein
MESNATNAPPQPPNPALDAIIADEVLRERVRSFVKPPPGKLPGFLSHPLALLVVGFILTGIVGNWLSSNLQDRFDQRRREAELREARRSAAEKVFRDVASSLDRRIYATRRYHLALSSRVDPDRLKSYRTQMDSAITDWNVSVNADAALICMYFGPQLALFLSRDIAGNLEVYSNQLKHPTGGITPEQLESQYRRLAHVAYAFDMRLGDRIRTGTVVLDRTGATCTKEAGIDEALPVLQHERQRPGEVTFDNL